MVSRINRYFNRYLLPLTYRLYKWGGRHSPLCLQAAQQISEAAREESILLVKRLV